LNVHLIIVTYYPKMDILKFLLKSITEQVKRTIIIDNTPKSNGFLQEFEN